MRLANLTVRHCWWLIFLLLLIPVGASAYSILDKGVVTVVLPPGWKMKSIGRHKDIIATNYEKSISKDQAENLAEISLNKDPNKTITDIVKGMSDRIKDQVLVEHCEVDDLKQLTVPESMFGAWMQVIQCKNSESSIIQLYLDTDPKTIYLFTYTLPGYPFTKEMRSDAIDILSSSIQVCYKGKHCYSFKNS